MISRRRLAAFGALAAAGCASGVASRIFSAPSSPLLLSRSGSTRATAYEESSKIVSSGSATHIAWQDSGPEGFRVKIRTLDNRSGLLSPEYTIGAAHDNHGGPALSIDGRGYLHVAYYPHQHPMRYRRSKRPNDASEWEDEIEFGEQLTYPTLLCAVDDTLHLTARRRNFDQPWAVEHWTKVPDGNWHLMNTILRSRYPGYSHFLASTAWSADRQTIHLLARIHEHSDRAAYGRLQTIGYMRSSDGGRSWCTSDGAPIRGAATSESIEVLATGGIDHGSILRAGPVAVDADDRVWCVYSVETGARGRLYAAHLDRGKAGWTRTDLTRFVPATLSTFDLTAPAGLTVTATGEVIVVAQLSEASVHGDATWGHRSSNVVALRTTDVGRTFSFDIVSDPRAKRTQWLPNIERATGHNVVPESPGLIYTSGDPGTTNGEIVSNDVYYTRV